MALMNTSESMALASTVLAGQCEKTKTDMGTLMERAGCAGDRLISVYVPRAESKGDDVVSVGLNGVKFYFMRGKTSKMPVSVAEVLYNACAIDEDPAQLVRELEAEEKAEAEKAAKKAAQKADGAKKTDSAK